MNIEEEKISIEKEKLKIELEKLKFQEKQMILEVKKTFWTSLSIAISFIIGALSITTSSINSIIQRNVQLKQTEIQNSAQLKQSEAQFNLKVAEIIMNTNSTITIQNRAKILSTIFNKYLPKDFGKQFNPYDYKNPNNDKNIDIKLELLKLISSNSSKKDEILSIWNNLLEDKFAGMPLPIALKTLRERNSEPKFNSKKNHKK